MFVAKIYTMSYFVIAYSHINQCIYHDQWNNSFIWRVLRSFQGSGKKFTTYIFFSALAVGISRQSPIWFNAVLDGNTVYTVAGDKLSNLDEFFDDKISVKPSSESIWALDPNKKYCARVWLSASASDTPNGGNKNTAD